MDRETIIKVMSIMKIAYPRFYANITKTEAEQSIMLWQDAFKYDDPNLLVLAVKELITTLQYPPTVADVKNMMRKITAVDEKNENDYWNELDKAVRNCLYNTQEVFDKLSDPIKRVIGSPAQLRELALSDADTFATVTKGQFLKQIKIVIEREKDVKSMSPDVKAFIASYNANMLNNEEVKKLEGGEKNDTKSNTLGWSYC